MVFFIFSSSYSYGNDEKPSSRLDFRCAKTMFLANDTVPAIRKIPDASTDSTASIIKEVPKARKQIAPIAIKVQPINIVKPKIIKPVIKIK